MSRIRSVKTFIILLMFFVLITIPADATSYYKWGFTLGSGISFTGDLQDMDSTGIPFSLGLLHRFSDSLEIFVHSDMFSMEEFYKSLIKYKFRSIESGARIFFDNVYVGGGAGLYYWDMTWVEYNSVEKNSDPGLFAEAGLRFGDKSFTDLKIKYIFGFEGLSYFKAILALGLLF